jgi:hypothetical protein
VCVQQFIQHMKSTDWATRYLSYYSTLHKMVKWATNCGLFNLYRIFCNQNPQKNMAHKAFLLFLANIWITSKPATQGVQEMGHSEQLNKHLMYQHTYQT